MSVMYPEGLNSATSSGTSQRTDRHHGIVGQKRTHLQCNSYTRAAEHPAPAERTGLSKSSVHRHLQAMGRRDRYPESSLWETEAGRAWLIRLVVATLFVFGLKPTVSLDAISLVAGSYGYYRGQVEPHAAP